MIMNINERIKQRRIKLGYTSHKAFGDVVGVSWQTVQQWEKEGGTAPNRNRMSKVAEVLKTTPEWLVHGIGPVEPDTPTGPAPTAQIIRQPEWMAEEAFRLLTFYYAADKRGRAQILDYAAGLSGHIAGDVSAGNQG